MKIQQANSAPGEGNSLKQFLVQHSSGESCAHNIRVTSYELTINDYNSPSLLLSILDNQIGRTEPPDRTLNRSF